MTSIVAQAALAIGSSLTASIIVKATVTAAIALLAAQLARRSRAALRHLLFAGAFGILLVLPIATLGLPVVDIAITTQTAVSPATWPGGADVASSSALNPTGTNGVAAISRPPLISMSAVLLTVWAAGALIFFLPVGAGLWQLRRVCFRARPWLPGATVLRRLESDTRIRRPVTVLLHESVSGPMTCGFFRSTILFPPDVQTWNDDDVRRALIHELEHVRRGDWLMHCIARSVCALYWFHPLVWTAWRRLILEAECACDDAVLRYEEPIGYAQQLVTLAQQLSTRSDRPLLAMANRRDLRARVTALLNRRQHRGRIGTLSVAAALTAAVLLAAVIAPMRAVATMQSPFPANEKRPAVEVASIKPIQSDAKRSFEFLPGGRVRANVELFAVIASAYEISWKQLEGNSPLLHERFDIEAKAVAGAIPEDMPARARARQVHLMLQTILADRFKLAIHKETKELPVYVLVVGKNGHRLQPAPPGRECTPDLRNCGGVGGGPAGGLSGINTEVSALAEVLTFFMDRYVIDRTGISGRFDIKIPSWNPSAQVGTQVIVDGREPAPNPTDPTIFTVLQESLGLRLESSRAPIDLYLIDHIEAPTPD